MHCNDAAPREESAMFSFDQGFKKVQRRNKVVLMIEVFLWTILTQLPPVLLEDDRKSQAPGLERNVPETRREANWNLLAKVDRCSEGGRMVETPRSTRINLPRLLRGLCCTEYT